MLLNPGALRPGFNFARVRCKDEVGWTSRFDPFEIIDKDSAVVVESLTELMARAKAGERICLNWT